jgi:hypothetical protein
VVLRRALEQREEIGVIERPAVDARQHLDAARTEPADGAVQLLERRGQVVHGKRGDEGREPVRVGIAYARHAIVREARQLGRALRPGGELWRRLAQCQHLLQVRPWREHAQALLHVPQRPDFRRVAHQGLLAGVTFERLEVRRRQHVVKDVDLHRPPNYTRA